jgi:hypothetical protein
LAEQLHGYAAELSPVRPALRLHPRCVPAAARCRCAARPVTRRRLGRRSPTPR